MIINGIDFDKRLDEAKLALHKVVDNLAWYHFEVVPISKYFSKCHIIEEKNPFTMIEWFKANSDKLYGIPKQ
jgi:hypothetical protein